MRHARRLSSAPAGMLHLLVAFMRPSCRPVSRLPPHHPTDNNASMPPRLFTLIPLALLGWTPAAHGQDAVHLSADAPTLVSTGQSFEPVNADAPRVTVADDLRFTGQVPTTTHIAAGQLFAAVPQAYSSVFKSNEDARFLMDTQD